MSTVWKILFIIWAVPLGFIAFLIMGTGIADLLEDGWKKLTGRE